MKYINAVLLAVVTTFVISAHAGSSIEKPLGNASHDYDSVVQELADDSSAETCAELEADFIGGQDFGLSDGEQFAQRCCKVCKKGKACGDSCISRSKTCHKGIGCACNG